MTEFGEHLKRKLITSFKRHDTDDNGLLEESDFHRIAERLIKTGNVSGPRADEIRKTTLELWQKYIKPSDGETSTVEAYLAIMKRAEKSDIKSEAFKQFNLYFDIVDADKDGSIQLEEFINYFRSLGMSEENARIAFKGLDFDQDGVLSREEFVKAGQEFYTLEEPSWCDLLYGPLV